MIPIAIPDLGSDRIRFSLWFVSVGESVLAGDRIAEVLIPGACCDVVSPATGVLTAIHAQPGDVLQAGDVLGSITLEFPVAERC